MSYRSSSSAAPTGLETQPISYVTPALPALLLTGDNDDVRGARQLDTIGLRRARHRQRRHRDSGSGIGYFYIIVAAFALISALAGAGIARCRSIYGADSWVAPYPGAGRVMTALSPAVALACRDQRKPRDHHERRVVTPRAVRKIPAGSIPRGLRRRRLPAVSAPRRRCCGPAASRRGRPSVAVLVALWSLRLGLHIVCRTARHRQDDPCYGKMVADWGADAGAADVLPRGEAGGDQYLLRCR